MGLLLEVDVTAARQFLEDHKSILTTMSYASQSSRINSVKSVNLEKCF